MKLGNAVLDLLFPPKCPFCTALLKTGEEHLCSACDLELPWMEDEEGRRPGEFLDDCAAPLWYRGPVRESHHRFKFGGRRAYARCFGALMAQCAQGQLTGDFDVITWAPVSKKRRRSRGYDQSQLLAEQLSRHMGIPALPLVEKIRHVPAQATILDESERRANVLGAYALHPRAQVSGLRILLVDDVVTTGSTLSECARVLRTAGAAGVVSLTLAMTPKGD